MKKFLSLLLAAMMLLSFAACSGGGKTAEVTPEPTEKATEEPQSNAIQLTPDNYSKYISVNGGASCNKSSDNGNALRVQSRNEGNGIETKSGSWTWEAYKSINESLYIKGLSQNFNYNDIAVTCKLKVTYKTYNNEKDDRGVYAFTGTETYEKEITVECDIAGNGEYKELYQLPNGYTHSDVIEYELEVISISGTVTPA